MAKQAQSDSEDEGLPGRVLDYAAVDGTPHISKLGILSFTLMMLTIPWAIAAAIIGNRLFGDQPIVMVLALSFLLPYFSAIVAGWVSIRRMGFTMKNAFGVIGFIVPLIFGAIVIVELGVAFCSR